MRKPERRKLGKETKSTIGNPILGLEFWEREREERERHEATLDIGSGESDETRIDWIFCKIL